MGGDPSIRSGGATAGPSTAEQLSKSIEEQLNRKIPTVQVALPDGKQVQGKFLTTFGEATSKETVSKVPGLGFFFELPRFFRFAIDKLTWAERKVLGPGVDFVESASGACQDSNGSNVPCRNLDATLSKTWAGHNQELINWSVRLAEFTGIWWAAETAIKSAVAKEFAPMAWSRISNLFKEKFLPLVVMCYLVDSKVLANPDKFLQVFDINGWLDKESLAKLRTVASVSEMTLALTYIASQYRHAANARVPNPLNPSELIKAPEISKWVSIGIALAYGVYYTLSENSAFQEAADTRIYGKAPRDSFFDFFNVTEWHSHVFSFMFAVSLFGNWAGTAKGWAVISKLSTFLNDHLWRLEEGVAGFLGHTKNMVFASPAVAEEAWLARSARGLYDFFKLPLTGYGWARPQISAPHITEWWQAGRGGAATYSAANTAPSGGWLARVFYHVRTHFNRGTPNPFQRILQTNPYIVRNKFTTQVANWERVTALENAAKLARSAVNLSPGIPELATLATRGEAIASAERLVVPEVSWLTSTYYRTAAGVSQRVVGSGVGLYRIFASPKRLAFMVQHSLVVASLGALGVLIMESSRGIPDDVADKVATRSLINILPNLPFRYGYAVAGIPISNWDFYLGNMTTTTPMLNMLAGQGSYSKVKTPQYLGDMRTASDSGEKARYFLYALQALAIADPKQPGEWKALTGKEEVAKMLLDAPASRGMMQLLESAVAWKHGQPITPDEVDKFPGILVSAGAISAVDLAIMNNNMTELPKDQFVALLPPEVKKHVDSATAHQAHIDARKQELGIK